MGPPRVHLHSPCDLRATNEECPWWDKCEFVGKNTLSSVLGADQGQLVMVPLPCFHLVMQGYLLAFTHQRNKHEHGHSILWVENAQISTSDFGVGAPSRGKLLVR